MKTIAALLVLFATTVSAQSVPTVQQQLRQMELQLLRDLMQSSTPYTVLPSSPYGGTVINNNTGRMDSYTTVPIPGLRMHLDSRGTLTRQYDLGNGMVIDLD